MANFVIAGKVSDIPEGTMRTVAVQGKKIALSHLSGEFFAIDDACSHEECSLGTEGFLDNGVVTCGCHGGQFDAKSGKVLALPPTRDVQSYEVKIEGDSILVGI